MALVLAIEPDSRQASILKRVIREGVHAELVVVDSRDAAVAAIAARVPDVILMTALLSPRDGDELIAHLRTLTGADHVQTHTIPQLASSSSEPETASGSGGLLGKFRKKKTSAPIPGCDPTSFANEVTTFLARAEEMKSAGAAVDLGPERAAARARVGVRQIGVRQRTRKRRRPTTCPRRRMRRRPRGRRRSNGGRGRCACRTRSKPARPSRRRSCRS